MNNYGFLVGPHFLGFTIIVTVLALIAVWSGRKIWVRIGAIMFYLLAIYASFSAVEDLLSRPKPVTFAELQSQIPEGHPGHLVLYGEATEEGIYLLLRSPAYEEPRYYFLLPPPEKKNDGEDGDGEKGDKGKRGDDKKPGKKMKEGFENAQREAKKKGTQLFLGGKPKKEDGKDGKGKGKSKGDRGGTGYDESPDTIFHPAPVSGGIEKDMTEPDRPVRIGTPSHSSPDGM